MSPTAALFDPSPLGADLKATLEWWSASLLGFCLGEGIVQEEDIAAFPSSDGLPQPAYSVYLILELGKGSQVGIGGSKQALRF